MPFDSVKELRDNLIYDVISSEKGDLTPHERLFIVKNSGKVDTVNQRWLVDLYMKCGCLVEAKRIYETLCHSRKLGDLAWISSDYHSAEAYYSKDEDRNGDVFRGGKDWDRLIKLYFSRSSWQKVIETVLEARISTFGDSIVLGSSSTPPKPYIKMLGIAVVKSKRDNDVELSHTICSIFSLKKTDWASILSISKEVQANELTKLQAKMPPRISMNCSFSLDEALERGKTNRAMQISGTIRSISSTLQSARNAACSFLKSGKIDSLSPVIRTVDAFSDESLAKTFLHELVANIYEEISKKKNIENVVQFYESHPLFRRLWYGELLTLKFENGIAISASDLYTGLLQSISSIAEDLTRISGKRRTQQPLLSFNKLVGFSDWTKMKIDDWLRSSGKQRIQDVISVWNVGRPQLVKTPFDSSKRPPNSPREMAEWSVVLKELHTWLTDMWQKDLGEPRWKSEVALFEMLKKSFKGCEIRLHSQPLWLEPQHLDIFLPEIGLAVEYMGEQHYKPIDFFGGQEGLKATTERDERKGTLCRHAGVKLEYVRFDENMKQRVEEILRHSSQGRGK